MKKIRQIPLPELPEYSSEEMRLRSALFFQNMSDRRTVRDFTDQPVDKEIIENCIKTAGSAPSGANMQNMFDPYFWTRRCRSDARKDRSCRIV